MRNRYLDLLRAAAIVRVIVYHLFGWPWLSIVLPAMGIMFALAGSLSAASLEKRSAGRVVTSRLRRLLPPLWLLGLVAVPVMLVAGWAHETDGEHPFSLPRLALWILPLGDPPGSDQGIDVWEPLWYIRAYVWFILLSPILYAFYRKAGWVAVAAPLALMAALDVTGFSLPDTADAAMWDFVTFGACWIAGFAHHDGRLARVRPWLAVAVAAVLGAAAIYWLNGHQGEDAWDLNDVSESQALWSLGFVLLALRWQPSMAWLSRIRPLDRTVTLLNARAVTVYLWHNIAIAAVWPVLTVVALDDLAGDLGGAVDLVVALMLTVLAILVFGWAEDLAARRRPRLWPTGAPALRTAAESEADEMPAPEPIAAASPTDIAAPVGAAPTDGHGPYGFARRTGAAAAMSRPAASWPPPSPRAAVDSGPADGTPVSVRAAASGRPGRHAAEIGGDTRADLGLPVAGRPAEPLVADEPITGEVLGPPGRARPGPPEWFQTRRGER